MKVILSLCFILILASLSLPAQTYRMPGTVKSAATNEPLAGVAILSEDSFLGQTDSAGNFAVPLPPGMHTLSFRLLGFHELQKTVAAGNDGPPLIILLEDDTRELGTVVVTAGRCHPVLR